DKDIVVLAGMKGKHVDPSVRPWDLKPGELPTTAKFGIDATIPEGIPAFRYERIVPAFRDEVRLEDYLWARPPTRRWSKESSTACASRSISATSSTPCATG